MKMPINFIIAILSLVISLFFFDLYAQAQPQPQSQVQPQIQRKTILDFKDELKLSEKQFKDIERLLQMYFKKEKEFADKIRERERRLNELLSQGGEMKEVKRLAKEIYCLRGELWGEELETARKIEDMLKDEQKRKWRELRVGRR
jgi:F0F1-type ATP synthase alpha subunit